LDGKSLFLASVSRAGFSDYEASRRHCRERSVLGPVKIRPPFLQFLTHMIGQVTCGSEQGGRYVCINANEGGSVSR